MASTPFSPAEAANPAAALRPQHLDGLACREALQALGGCCATAGHPTLEEDSRIPLEVPMIVHRGDALVLDAQTCRNLELTATQGTTSEGSLLWAIDRTLTAMGGRCPLAGSTVDGPGHPAAQDR